jgi:hypothetical protein
MAAGAEHVERPAQDVGAWVGNTVSAHTEPALSFKDADVE